MCLPMDSSPAPILQRRQRCPGSGAARLPPSASDILPRRGPRRPAGYASLHSNQQNRAGNRFPLARRQGFLHAPRRRGLGKPCRGIITATSQAKPIPPPPPTALLRMCGGQLTYVSLFPTVTPPTEIYVQYFTGLLFVRTYATSTALYSRFETVPKCKRFTTVFLTVGLLGKK
jgi:hypothetical protein